MDNLLTDVMAYLIGLSGNERAQNTLLYFVIGCWLIAIAGGGLIKIADKQIGNLKVPARIVSFILGCIALVVYILIPSPNLMISGIFSESTFPKHMKHKYQVRLTPVQLVKETEIGEEGFFQFVPSHEVKKGRYYVSVLKDNEVIFNREQTIDPAQKDILVLKDENTYTVKREKVVDYFCRLYSTERLDWMKRYRAERILRNLAKRDPNVEKFFLKKLETSNSENERILACWVLGGIVHEKARDVLITIFEDKDDTYSPFDQIKAAFFLSQYIGKYPGKTETLSTVGQRFLLKILKDEKIKLGVRDVTKYAHGAAAFYLTDLGMKCRLVYDSLIPHIKHEDQEVSDETVEKLKLVTGRSELNSVADWESLKEQERDNLNECPGFSN
jgi:hypothetical protein